MGNYSDVPKTLEGQEPGVKNYRGSIDPFERLVPSSSSSSFP